jgi:hypothetical protein
MEDVRRLNLLVLEYPVKGRYCQRMPASSTVGVLSGWTVVMNLAVFTVPVKTAIGRGSGPAGQEREDGQDAD